MLFAFAMDGAYLIYHLAAFVDTASQLSMHSFALVVVSHPFAIMSQGTVQQDSSLRCAQCRN